MTTEKKPTTPKKNKSTPPRKGQPPVPARGLAVSFLLMAIFLTAMYLFSDSSKNSGELDYSDFVTLVKSGRVSKVDIAHDGAGNHNRSRKLHRQCAQNERSATSRFRRGCHREDEGGHQELCGSIIPSLA